jgi:hypothetical protein
MNLRSLKLIIASSSIIILTGCAVVTKMYDAYFMTGYDNYEYALVNKIRSTAEIGIKQCDSIEISKNNFESLYNQSIEFKNFTQYIPRNEDTIKLSNNIHDLIKQGSDAYNSSNSVSPTFCKLKLQQVIRSSETAQKVIGSKPR